MTQLQLVLEVDNEVTFDADETNERVISLSIGSTSMGYSALVNGVPFHGRVAFSSKLPDEVMTMLREMVEKP